MPETPNDSPLKNYRDNYHPMIQPDPNTNFGILGKLLKFFIMIMIIMALIFIVIFLVKCTTSGAC